MKQPGKRRDVLAAVAAATAIDLGATTAGAQHLDIDAAAIARLPKDRPDVFPT